MNVWFQDWSSAERTAVHHLGPQLVNAERAGLITNWWFIRKDACWRVRYQNSPGHSDDKVRDTVADVLDGLTADSMITRWARTHYEPESRAFGGPSGMDIAHTLFHADSHHILEHLRRSGDRHRNELSVLLAGTLLSGATQDYYEQGDIFTQVAAHRPSDRPPTSTETDGIHRLLTARTTTIDWGPSWPEAFHDAGAALADLAHQGRLDRGLRAVLAHHILFAWNRAGVPARHQGLLADAAATAIFNRPPHRPAVRRSPTSFQNTNPGGSQ
jgi:thiopeptide-type bacteriocin biosynthesis protein